MANEVFHENIFQVSTTSIGLDHHHLVRVHGIDISVDHVRNRDVSTERTECRPPAPVAVNILYENVLRWTL